MCECVGGARKVRPSKGAGERTTRNREESGAGRGRGRGGGGGGAGPALVEVVDEHHGGVLGRLRAHTRHNNNNNNIVIIIIT